MDRSCSFSCLHPKNGSSAHLTGITVQKNEPHRLYIIRPKIREVILKTWRLTSWIQTAIPELPELGTRQKLRACLGAVFGILITAAISTLITPTEEGRLWLIAPMGASAIILFTLPSSPLAQPWSIIGGNLISALVGITCLHMFNSTLVCVSVAIFVAPLLMLSLRCLHPPSGAVAMLTILGGDAVKDLGYMFVINPIGLNTVLLVMCAVIYNKATGQNYPHLKSIRQNDRDNSTQISTASSAGLIKSDLTAALRQSKQLIDVDINDLESLFLQTERLAYNRRSVGLQCQQVMTKNIDTLEFSTELNEAWQIIKKRNMQALPVLSRGGHLLGIVTRSDFLREVEIHEFSRFKTQLKNLLKKNNNSTSNKAEVVGQIMRTNIQTALDTSPMIDLAPLMIDQKIRHIAVVNERGLFVGMINQTDMISALYQTTLGLKHQ